MAPRPHNSGHPTTEACLTSQFEQLVRACCNLPLGSTEALRPVAIANLLGDLWSGGQPRFEDALAVEGVTLHLYGKDEARPGRKMGHLSATARTPDEAIARVLEARRRLQPRT
jgi:5-(carboxyamino)imidazole ribonucleotide synthase